MIVEFEKYSSLKPNNTCPAFQQLWNTVHYRKLEISKLTAIDNYLNRKAENVNVLAVRSSGQLGLIQTMIIFRVKIPIVFLISKEYNIIEKRSLLWK